MKALFVVVGRAMTFFALEVRAHIPKHCRPLIKVAADMIDAAGERRREEIQLWRQRVPRKRLWAARLATARADERATEACFRIMKCAAGRK